MRRRPISRGGGPLSREEAQTYQYGEGPAIERRPSSKKVQQYGGGPSVGRRPISEEEAYQ